MESPFNGISKEYGETLLAEKFLQLKQDIQNYYNKKNLVAFSPAGAHSETIPEKPAILEYVEEIQSSGHLLMPGGLMQQPFVFMREYKMALALKTVFDSIMNANQGE